MSSLGPASVPLSPAACPFPEAKKILIKAEVCWLKNTEVVELLTRHVEYLLPVSREPPNQPPGAACSCSQAAARAGGRYLPCPDLHQRPMGWVHSNDQVAQSTCSTGAPCASSARMATTGARRPTAKPCARRTRSSRRAHVPCVGAVRRQRAARPGPERLSARRSATRTCSTAITRMRSRMMAHR